MQAEGWLQILNRIAPHAQRLKITGGEPTLHPDFSSIITDIDQRGIDFTLFTNARWHDPAGLLTFLKKQSHLTGLLVSLHGAVAASHEAFTGVTGSFEETLVNVRAATQESIPVALSTVLTRCNAGELSELTSLAERVRARTLIVNRYMGAPISGLTLNDEDLLTVVAQIERLRAAGRPVKYGNCVPHCFTPNSSVGCMAGIAYCAIDPWGNLRPCTLSSLRAGNVLENRLEDLWQSPVMETFRSSIPSGCHRCPAFSVCHGGCKALALEMERTADPLAHVGDPVTLPPVESVILDPAWRPRTEFKIRTEFWGLVLMYGNQLLPVRHEARPLLNALNGERSIADLRSDFGEPALSLIGALYQRSMITFSL